MLGQKEYFDDANSMFSFSGKLFGLKQKITETHDGLA